MQTRSTYDTNFSSGDKPSTYEATNDQTDPYDDKERQNALISPTDARRFQAKVKGGPPEACWEWTAYTDRDGYGRFSLNGKKVRAHRVAVRLDGRDPTGQVVRHTCDNPACVNPNHLQCGTPEDNARDMVKRGRQPRGERNGQSKLSRDEVLTIRESSKPSGLLAGLYDVAASTIRTIRTGASWSHL
jgi:hypothetical protein